MTDFTAGRYFEASAHARELARSEASARSWRERAELRERQLAEACATVQGLRDELERLQATVQQLRNLLAGTVRERDTQNIRREAAVRAVRELRARLETIRSGDPMADRETVRQMMAAHRAEAAQELGYIVVQDEPLEIRHSES